MQNKTEQTAVPSEFRLFRGREKPQSVLNHFSEEKNPWKSVPNHFSEQKPQNSVPNYFSEEKIPWNSIPNHFSEEKNPWNSIPNHFWMRKTLEFRSEPFLEEKKPRNYVLNHFLKRKNFGILFRIIFLREKNFLKTTFVSCFVKLHCFAEFRFVPSYGMDSSEILRITRNEHFIPRSNKNCISGQNTSGRQDSPVMNTFGTLDS
jgi:hypothetical protein